MLFSAPTGFMAPPLHGVFVAVSCSGTLEQGSPFRVRAHSNYSVVVAIWTFVVCAIYTCPVIGVRCCKAWAIHPVFEKNVFSFQILVLSYELFTSLAFFSHYPGDNQSHEVYLQLSDETIILCLQSLLDLFTSRIHPPWTLLGLLHNRKLRMGILKHPAERGLHSHLFCHRSPFFQPPTRWWPITRGTTYKIWRENYILSAYTVGFIYVPYPPSMNPVGAVPY